VGQASATLTTKSVSSLTAKSTVISTPSLIATSSSSLSSSASSSPESSSPESSSPESSSPASGSAASSSSPDGLVNDVLSNLGLSSPSDQTSSSEGQSDPESIKYVMLRAFYDLRSCFDNQLKDVHQQLKDVHHKIDCLVQTNAELVEFYKSNESNTKKSNASHAPIVSIFIIVLSLNRHIILLYTVLV
jgi:hypothetical protein